MFNAALLVSILSLASPLGPSAHAESCLLDRQCEAVHAEHDVDAHGSEVPAVENAGVEEAVSRSDSSTNFYSVWRYVTHFNCGWTGLYLVSPRQVNYMYCTYCGGLFTAYIPW